MKSDFQYSRSEAKPVILTTVLIIGVFFVFFSIRMVQSELYLTISLWLFALIDIGFIISMIMGIRTKKIIIVLFSIMANGLLFAVLTVFLLFVCFALGFSEP